MNYRISKLTIWLTVLLLIASNQAHGQEYSTIAIPGYIEDSDPLPFSSFEDGIEYLATEQQIGTLKKNDALFAITIDNSAHWYIYGKTTQYYPSIVRQRISRVGDTELVSTSIFCQASATLCEKLKKYMLSLNPQTVKVPTNLAIPDSLAKLAIPITLPIREPAIYDASIGISTNIPRLQKPLSIYTEDVGMVNTSNCSADSQLAYSMEAINPAAEIMDGRHGTARVFAIWDYQGELVHSSIERSTRNRALDRSAIALIQSWAMVPPSCAAKGYIYKAIIPINFSPAQKGSYRSLKGLGLRK